MANRLQLSLPHLGLQENAYTRRLQPFGHSIRLKLARVARSAQEHATFKSRETRRAVQEEQTVVEGGTFKGCDRVAATVAVQGTSAESTKPALKRCRIPTRARYTLATKGQSDSVSKEVTCRLVLPRALQRGLRCMLCSSLQKNGCWVHFKTQAKPELREPGRVRTQTLGRKRQTP